MESSSLLLDLREFESLLGQATRPQIRHILEYQIQEARS